MLKTMTVAALAVFAVASTALADTGPTVEPASAAAGDTHRAEPARGRQQTVSGDTDQTDDKDDERPFFYAIDMATRMLG